MQYDELVNEIVRRVLERVNGQMSPVAPAPSAVHAPAVGPLTPLTPPAFAPAAIEPLPAPMPLANNVPSQCDSVRRVFVTAEQLVRRIAADKSITLAPQERLTPNAQDYVDAHGIRVQQLAPAPAQAVGPAQGASPATRVLPAAETVGVVIFGGGPTVLSALTALGREGMAMPRFDATDCWMRNSSAMIKSILAGQIGGGVILVPTGSAATVFANKYRGIRAVLGGCADGVAEAVRELDANVLIVEHKVRAFFEVRTLIKTFITHRRQPRPATAMLDTLARLEAKP